MKYGYMVQKQSESVSTDTRHVELDIVRLDDRDTNGGKRIVSLGWQADRSPRDDKPRYWYGMRFVPSDIGSMDDLNEVSRLTRRIMPADMGWFYVSPVDVIEACENKKMRRVWYDSRISNYVTLDEMPDLTLDRWLAIDSSGRCIVDCLASDEDMAIRLLMGSFAENISKRPMGGWTDYAGKLESWLAAGKPIKNASSSSYGQQAPIVVDTVDLLRLDEVAEVSV